MAQVPGGAYKALATQYYAVASKVSLIHPILEHDALPDSVDAYVHGHDDIVSRALIEHVAGSLRGPPVFTATSRTHGSGLKSRVGLAYISIFCCG